MILTDPVSGALFWETLAWSFSDVCFKSLLSFSFRDQDSTISTSDTTCYSYCYSTFGQCQLLCSFGARTDNTPKQAWSSARTSLWMTSARARVMLMHLWLLR
jgi:hypothetical protein